jgi:hypothetical protein
MPVSKKRKKDGKPARRAAPATPSPEQEHAHAAPEAKPGAPLQRVGKPSNPFVALMPKRAAQRGR